MPASKSRLISKAFSKDGALSSTATVGVEPKLETGEVVLNTADDLPLTGNSIGDQAFVEETGRLYIWSGAGWYNIALINETPTITSAGDANYTMSYGTPINIKVDATDPEELPLTYSYYTTDNIGNAATITNDSSQFTITPTSDLNVDATFGLLFRASDGVNVASSSTSNFTLFNQPPSLSGNDSSYVLSTVGAAMTISLSSTDPEGQAVTYTVTADSGFNAIATVSSDSSVFTVTPKSQAQAPSGGTGTLTFTASDGVKTTDGLSSFSLTFINSTVLNSKYTELLLTANGTTDNNDITDGSASNHTITVNNDAHAGTFSPYRHGGYSTYFDGAGDYLEVPWDSSFTLDGEFTIDAWVYYTSGSQSYWDSIISIGDDASTGSGALSIYHSNGTGASVDGGLALQIGGTGSRIHSPSQRGSGWHHVVATRDSSSVVRFFIDGILQGTMTNSTVVNNTTYGCRIGLGTTAQNNYFHGYVSDVRIVKGSVVTDYQTSSVTTNDQIFTPPTERLTAITNTSLLTCHLPYIADGSSNAHAITVNGNTSVKPFTPYDNLEYSAADHGGSIYFDGTGDALVLNSSTGTDFTFGTGDFTIEAWAYPIAINNNPYDTIFTLQHSGDWNTGNTGLIMSTASFSSFLSPQVTNYPSGSIPINQWTHLAIVRSSGTIKVYRNGIEDYSTTLTHDFSSSYDPGIGVFDRVDTAGGRFYFNGYIADLRVKKSAEYTSAFTPPTSPLSSTGSTLHIKGTDASIIDKAQFGDKLTLVDNTSGSTTAKFASTNSIYFNQGGSADYISIPSRDGFILGSEDFTVEMWYYIVAVPPTTSASYWARLIECGAYNVANTWRLNLEDGTTKVQFQIGDTITRPEIFSSTTVSLNTWHHVAVTRSGNTIKLFIDGTQEGGNLSYSGSFIAPPNGSLLIGAGTEYGNIVNPYYGNLQDVRITKGLARYTANFTPPTAPLEG